MPPNFENNKKEETRVQASDVKNFVWVKVEDWSTLTESVHTFDDGMYVGAMDLEDFIENIFRKCANQLNIPYEELKPILEEKNAEFYAEKDKIFAVYAAFAKTHVQFYKLKNLLKIPDILSVPAEMSKSKVEKLLEDFENLADEEKREVMQRLGVVLVQG